MTALAWTALSLLGVFLFAALGDLVSEEIRGWLDLAPRGVLRLATRRIDPELRESIYEDEWLPDLMYYLRGAEARPITRLVRGTTFAFGLLLAAPGIARYHVPASQPIGESPQSTDDANFHFEFEHRDYVLQIKGRVKDTTAVVESINKRSSRAPLKPGEIILPPRRHPPASH
jgi:hypothetical protein